MKIKNRHGTTRHKETGIRKKGWWGRYLEKLARSKPPKSAQMGTGCGH